MESAIPHNPVPVTGPEAIPGLASPEAIMAPAGTDFDRPLALDQPLDLTEVSRVLENGARHMDRNELLKILQEVLGQNVLRRLGLIPIPSDLMLSVVVPVYNEARTIREILRQIEAVPINKEIILVDDFSTDGTRELLREIEQDENHGSGGAKNRLCVCYHECNRGKGAALRTGFQKVTGTVVIVQDADLEYDPSEYPQLIAPIIDGRADVVYGSRFIGETHRVLYFWHYLGNKALTMISNMFTGLNLTDMETCYKVFRSEVMKDIAPTLKSNRFGFEPEVTAKVAKRRLRVYELPISYSGREYSEGKHITWKDGFSALWCILRYWWAD